MECCGPFDEVRRRSKDAISLTRIPQQGFRGLVIIPHTLSQAYARRCHAAYSLRMACAASWTHWVSSPGLGVSALSAKARARLGRPFWPAFLLMAFVLPSPCPFVQTTRECHGVASPKPLSLDTECSQSALVGPTHRTIHVPPRRRGCH